MRTYHDGKAVVRYCKKLISCGFDKFLNYDDKPISQKQAMDILYIDYNKDNLKCLVKDNKRIFYFGYDNIIIQLVIS